MRAEQAWEERRRAHLTAGVKRLSSASVEEKRLRQTWRARNGHSPAGQLIVVTGAAGGCGRSTSVMNLALALAETQRVLCVDARGVEGITLAHWRRLDEEEALTTKILQPDDELGLESYRANRERFNERLDVLRTWPGDPYRFGLCVRQLAADYDAVLVDSGDGYSVAEQSVLAWADLLLVVGGLNLAEARRVAGHVQYLGTFGRPGQPIPIRTLLHRAWQRSEDLHRQLRAAYEEYAAQAPLLATEISGDEAYQRALERGEAVLESGLESVAASQYRAVVREVEQALQAAETSEP